MALLVLINIRDAIIRYVFVLNKHVSSIPIMKMSLSLRAFNCHERTIIENEFVRAFQISILFYRICLSHC